MRTVGQALAATGKISREILKQVIHLPANTVALIRATAVQLRRMGQDGVLAPGWQLVFAGVGDVPPGMLLSVEVKTQVAFNKPGRGRTTLDEPALELQQAMHEGPQGGGGSGGRSARRPAKGKDIGESPDGARQQGREPELVVESSSAARVAGMARRVANTGAFSDLAVPMQMRAVKKMAAQGGVGLKGVKVRIVRDPDLVGSGLMGYTHPGGKMIDLYPDAFRSAESLVKTLGHERMHVMQMRVFGTPTTAAELGLNETAAYGIEGSFWNFFRGS